MEQTAKLTKAVRSSFYEVEQARRERLVRSVYRVTLGFVAPFISLLLVVMLPEGDLLTTIAFINIAGIIPVCLLANKIIDYDRMDLGILIYVIYLLYVLTLNTTILQGISDVLIPGSMLLIVLSGMMLSPKHSFLVATIAAGLYIGTRLLPEGFFPSFVDPGPWPRVYVTSLTIMAFIFVAVINQISFRDLRQSLDEATFKLVNINKQLEVASERKSRFTARTSHELRTPLSALIAFSDLALRGAYGPINDRLRNALEHVLHSARHLKNIINDILDLTKIEAGELEIVESAFELREIVATMEATIQNSVVEKELDFNVSISPEMPEVIIGDEGRICQILVNLTSNAVKFTDEGSVEVKIALSKPDFWSIEVSDTGPGIPRDQYETIFQAYRQLQRSKSETKVKGTGLGLAITRNLVQMMGGELVIDSKVGVGTSFTVELPLNIHE